MKSCVLRFRATDQDSFESLGSGLKRIETRVATPRYKKVQSGDRLVILCAGERVEKQVAVAHWFPSIEKMLEQLDVKEIMPQADSLEEVYQSYYSYPGYKEKIAELGIVAWELVPL